MYHVRSDAMKVVLLGCGFHGRGIGYQLAAAEGVELSVLDLDGARAEAVGEKAGVPSGTADVTDPEGLREGSPARGSS